MALISDKLQNKWGGFFLIKYSLSSFNLIYFYPRTLNLDVNKRHLYKGAQGFSIHPEKLRLYVQHVDLRTRHHDPHQHTVCGAQALWKAQTHIIISSIKAK